MCFVPLGPAAWTIRESVAERARRLCGYDEDRPPELPRDAGSDAERDAPPDAPQPAVR